MKFSTVWFSVGATSILLSDSSSFVLGKIKNECDAIAVEKVQRWVCEDKQDCEVDQNNKCVNVKESKSFENLGKGYCRDSEGNLNGNWRTEGTCGVGVTKCQKQCKATGQCIGISWAKNPSKNINGCKKKGQARCAKYFGTVPPIEKTSVNESEEYTCYRYGQPVSVPTDAPTNAPTDSPTDAPTNAPTNAPTDEPTDAPTNAPTDAPTDVPTAAPSAGPSVTPRGVCENEKNYQKDGKDCNTLSKKGKCNKEDETNNYPPFDETKKVKFFCPYECDSTCWPVRDDCENEPNYQLNGKDCDKWKEKGKCNKKDKTNTYPPFGEKENAEKVKFFCPLQCKNACSTNAPTTTPSSNPTPAPSASPTPAPSASPSAAPSESPSASLSDSPSESPSASPTTDAPTMSPTSEEPVSQSPTESSSGSSSDGSSGSGSD